MLLDNKAEIGGALSIQFSQDNNSVFIGGKQGIWLIDIEQKRVIKRFDVSLTWYNQMAISSRGKYLLTGTKNDHLVILDIPSGKTIIDYPLHAWIEGVAISYDEQIAISGCSDGNVYLWDLASRKMVRKFQPDDRTIQLSEIGDLDERKNKDRKHFNSRNSVSISPDGKRIISGSYEDKTMYLWDISTAKELARFVHNSELVNVKFSPDNHHAVSGCMDGSVYTWKLPS